MPGHKQPIRPGESAEQRAVGEHEKRLLEDKEQKPKEVIFEEITNRAHKILKYL